MISKEELQDAEFPEVKKGGLDRLIRVYGYVMAAVYKWRKKAGAAGPVIINSAQLPNGKVFGYLSIQCLRAAELFLLERAQKGMKTSRTKSLNVDTVTEEDVIGVKRKLIVIGTGGRNQIQGVYGQTDLPVLAKDHKLSELCVQLPSTWTRGGDHHLAQIEKEGVDRQWTSISRFNKGPLHRMPTERKKMHGAEDGPPAGP